MHIISEISESLTLKVFLIQILIPFYLSSFRVVSEQACSLEPWIRPILQWCLNLYCWDSVVLKNSSFSIFFFFSVLYMVIVLGNFLIILTVTSDTSLHSPMYFLLGNLSFVDICQASFATPKMIADFLSEHKAISFSGCIAQIFFIHLFTGGEMVLLVSMAYDRYVAICKPLYYVVIMS